MLSFSIEELGALKLVLANMTVKELIAAAEVGFTTLAPKDDTSSSAELASICTYALTLLG